MSLILHNASSSASFAKYVQREQARIEVENSGITPDALSPRSVKASADARIAESQLFATDVLYELSKEFVFKSEAAPDLNTSKMNKSSA